MADSEVNAGGSDPLDRCIAHGLYCVLAVLAVSQTLLVGFNCLPLVLRDRVFGVLRQSRSLRKLLTALKFIVSSRFHSNHSIDKLSYFFNWLLAWLILISFDNASDGNVLTLAAEIVPFFLTVFFATRKPFNQIINIFKKAQHPAERVFKARRIERSILCIKNISSILAQQSLICEGRELMASASLENSDTVAKTLGLERGDDRLVAIVFAVAEKNKTRSELGLLGRYNIAQDQEDGWILEGIPSWMQIADLVEGFVQLDSALDRHALCRQFRIHRPLGTAEGGRSRLTSANYFGSMTPTLMKYLRGEKAVPAQHPALAITNNLFVRPNASDEPYILIKSTPELRKFLAVLICTGFKKREAELFLKLYVDAAVPMPLSSVWTVRAFWPSDHCCGSSQRSRAHVKTF